MSQYWSKCHVSIVQVYLCVLSGLCLILCGKCVGLSDTVKLVYKVISFLCKQKVSSFVCASLCLCSGLCLIRCGKCETGL